MKGPRLTTNFPLTDTHTHSCVHTLTPHTHIHARTHAHTHTHTQSLKSEYNSLAPSFTTCTEDGASLAKYCESPEAKAALEEGVGLLLTQWEGLGKLFGEVLQKLTDALVQVKPFFLQ